LGIPVEVALVRDKLDELRRRLGQFAIGHVEIPDGVLNVTGNLRLGLQGDTLRLFHLEG
jgi:hypothetical protein